LAWHMAGAKPMKDSALERGSSLPPDVRQRIDEACARFEQALRSGQRPAIEACIAPLAPAERPELEYELLRLELDYRLEHGNKPTAEEYLWRFPEYASVVERAFAWAASRANAANVAVDGQRAGETVSLDQFRDRLVQSGLLARGQLAKFQQGLTPDRLPRDAQSLARELILAGVLTKFQAQAVYRGL
jgi:hypothetical protein